MNLPIKIYPMEDEIPDEHLAGWRDGMIDTAKKALLNDGGLRPIILAISNVGHRDIQAQGPALVEIPIEDFMSSPGGKDDLADALPGLFHHVGCRAYLMVSDAFFAEMPTGVYDDTMTSISDSPHRRECLLFLSESPKGSWQLVLPYERAADGSVTRFCEPLFEGTDPGGLSMAGRFANLLAKYTPLLRRFTR